MLAEQLNTILRHTRAILCPLVLCMQEQISQLFDEAVGKLVREDSLNVANAYRVYSLSSVLDYPLDANTDASMSKLCRHCQNLRPILDDQLLHALITGPKACHT